jgi:hypothetical protein
VADGPLPPSYAVGFWRVNASAAIKRQLRPGVAGDRFGVTFGGRP